MLSIIICTYNRDKYLYNALKNIAENDFPYTSYEIILINNNSTDNTETECRHFRADFPNVDFRYFIEPKQGLSHARNRGIKEARGDLYIFLDDDSFVKKNYLMNLEKNIKLYPDILAYGGKIIPLFESGKAPAWLSKWTYSWVSAIDLGDKSVLFKNNKYPIGANMGISKNSVDVIGFFNPQLGRTQKNLLAGEEKDFFYRLKKIKGEIRYLPDIEVEHVIPESRTTIEYIKRMGLGIGISEKLRTLPLSKIQYFKRLFLELVKWSASIILCAGFILIFQPVKGTVLLLFRWYVTKGLLSK
ncbi:MAG: glycosyltransferase [Dysgonamonadaceae bacterium]|jgi:glycosyltransferase involved in cell wall biosynthesis|nr:glycosyltransferase [Dysgonamonadaceae bacterium]